MPHQYRIEAMETIATLVRIRGAGIAVLSVEGALWGVLGFGEVGQDHVAQPVALQKADLVLLDLSIPHLSSSPGRALCRPFTKMVRSVPYIQSIRPDEIAQLQLKKWIRWIGYQRPQNLRCAPADCQLSDLFCCNFPISNANGLLKIGENLFRK